MARMNWDRVRTEQRISSNGSDWLVPSLGLSDPHAEDLSASANSETTNFKRKNRANPGATQGQRRKLNTAIAKTNDHKMRLLLKLAKIEVAIRAGHLAEAASLAVTLADSCKQTSL